MASLTVSPFEELMVIGIDIILGSCLLPGPWAWFSSQNAQKKVISDSCKLIRSFSEKSSSLLLVYPLIAFQ